MSIPDESSQYLPILSPFNFGYILNYGGFLSYLGTPGPVDFPKTS